MKKETTLDKAPHTGGIARLVRPMATGEEDAVADVLTTAFDRDPLAQWFFPDAAIRQAAYRQLFEQATRELAPGALVDVTDTLDAAAIWNPPGHVPSWTPPPNTTPAAATLFAALEASMPPPPFWYLEFLGARTSGSGGGSALMRSRLANLSGPIAFWTANEANLDFYQRFGCTLAGRADAPGIRAWWLTHRYGV